MGQIQILNQNTIDQIAAGEVIERPASIVKELVENSIDAGATVITVEIREGGLSLIRVGDNGAGISHEDVHMAFLRHSTSKIHDTSDLEHLLTLGFRGEALSSIAAVSQTELISHTQEEESGTRYLIEGGIEVSNEYAGAPCGTTLYVRNLFYNTPARRKFLKTPMTEASHVQEILTRLALSHSEVSFSFISNGNEKLMTPGSGNPEDSIYSIYGRETVAHLIRFSASSPYMGVSGFIGDPQLTRGNRNYESFFINGRYFKNPVVAKAVEEAFSPYMMQHKYPFAVLYLTVDPDQIDVNVHPGKMEIRFSRQQELYKFILDSVSEALKNREMIPGAHVSQVSSAAITDHAAATNTVLNTMDGIVKDNTVHYRKSDVPNDKAQAKDFFFDEMRKRVALDHKEKQASFVQAEKRDYSDTQPDTIQKDEKILTPGAVSEYRLIGQLFSTYWLAEYHDDFLMIDQHAAHEKVLYEKLLKRLASEDISSQMVLPPVILRLTMAEQQILSDCSDTFSRMGFEIEPFGGNDFAVHGIPTMLPSLAKNELLNEIFDELSECADRTSFTTGVQEKIASISCKAAVKGNQTLSEAEMKALIESLLTLDNPYFCPHGRPTMIVMTKSDIEKKFKRIV